MIKVLIADDKKIERNYLKQFLEQKYSKDVTVVAAVQDGREVIDFMSHSRVDLLLLDIQMPKIDGLEVAQQVRISHPDVEVILITAYAEFSYAKQAIKIGVTDYLLKPYMDEELQEIMDNSLIKISKNTPELYNGGVSHGYVDAPYFELKMAMNKILLDKHKHELGKEVFANQPFNHSDYKVVVFFSENLSNISMDMLQIVLGIFRKRNLYVLGYVDGKEIIIYLFGNKKIDFVEMDTSIKKAVKFLNDEKVGEVFCGVSGFYCALETMHPAYAEATSFITEFSPLTIQKAFINNMTEREKGYAKLHQLLQAIIMKNHEEMQKIYRYLIHQIMDDKGLSLAYMGYYLIASVYDVLNCQGEKNKEIHTFMRSAQQNYNAITAMEELVYDLVQSLSQRVGDVSVYNNVTLTAKAKDYIQAHYHEKITLQEVADRLDVSYGHLSKCFSQVETIPFNRYLLETRIKQAKKLMTRGEKTISEIAYAIGIDDPNYFSKCFKRVTNMAPKEYMTMQMVENSPTSSKS
ncbi:response regulator [Vallitaleaceae bacterium 9-2]